MSVGIVTTLLQERLTAIWAGRTTIAWNNVDYTPKRNVPFIRETLHGIDSEKLSIKCTRDRYSYTIQVFIPNNTGTLNSDEMVDLLINSFYGYAEGKLIVTEAYSDRIGITEEWYQVNVIIYLHYDNNHI